MEKIMNSKRTIAGLATAAALLAVSAGANAAVYDHAKVISSRPIVRYVNVKTPVRECWQDTEYYTSYEPRRHAPGRTLAGAIIGGVIGHQIGSGRGNDAATIAGSMLGAAIGHGPVRRVESSRPVERCETHYRNQREQRIDGYNVVYRYNGQKYSTRMPYDPGKRIKVRVDIRPAG
jgi:uncharacterized protein YcfJ